jgi:peroxiredoxin
MFLAIGPNLRFTIYDLRAFSPTPRSRGNRLPQIESTLGFELWAFGSNNFPMALTPSTMLPLGTTAPDFKLPATDGKTISLGDFKNQAALLVIFMCNHCPYVVHIRAGLAQLARDYAPRDVGIVGINANDAKNYPADSPARMKDEVQTAGYLFPYLYDETQAVAKAYRAACTPDIFLFDRGRRLVYRGQFDASRPGNGMPVTGKDLRAALEAVLAGKPTAERQVASIGCNIKWKAGNEPDYY